MKNNVIKCPACGAEYLMSEIYLPNSFMGRPTYIERNSGGKILDCFGDLGDMVENYRCDYCDKFFTVEANVQFKTFAPTKANPEEHVTKIEKKALF